MCGSGEEANRNNSFPYKAALAQPSGLALNTGNYEKCDNISLPHLKMVRYCLLLIVRVVL